ncbi:hypothetical protein C2S51_018573 [Perilla frutescens var. frutescens]|nr:hypothetical protein C2S51_018573 [Perilla frutescens var. frutescens]
MCCDFLDKFDADCLEAKFHQQVNLRYLDHSLYFDNDYSGYGLRLEVWLSYKEDNQSFTKKVREEGLNSNSLHLTSYYRHRGEKKLKGIEDAEVPNKPKRPPRAFFVFMENFMKQYNEKHPNNKSTAAIVKAGGDKWKSMSEEEKTSVAEAEEYGQKMEAGSNRKLAGGGDNDPGKSKSEVDDEDEEEGSGEFSRLYEAFESLIFGNLH